MSLFEDDFDNDFDDDIGGSPDIVTSENILQKPQQSSYCIGHVETEKDLLSLWNSGRMPHAIVLNGLKGIGKATFAYRLSRFILKESEGGDTGGGLFGDDVSPENFDIPTDHHVFSKVASGGHPDILTIGRPFDDRKGQYKDDIPVDDIRKIAPFLRKTSGSGGWRIVIVDDANTMNRNGQNALLKILEEPPKNALLILVCHGAGGLLPTIRSRCRFVSMNTLSTENMSYIVNKHEGASSLMPSDKELLFTMAEGSAGQAIEMMEEGGLDSLPTLIHALSSIDTLSVDQIDALALSYGKSGDAKAVKYFRFILNWWFETIIKLSVENTPHKTIGGMDVIVPTGQDLKTLLNLHEEVEAHMQECLNGNLDKRYMIFKTLRMIQDGTR